MTTVSFPNSTHPPVELSEDTPLSLGLTLENSPILFGCRTGICGTCLVSATGDLEAPDAEEQEMLDVLTPDCSSARLACQIKAGENISLTPIKP